MSRGNFVDGLFLEWKRHMHVCGCPDTLKKERLWRGAYMPYSARKTHIWHLLILRKITEY